jgi:hypothetical protein
VGTHCNQATLSNQPHELASVLCSAVLPSAPAGNPSSEKELSRELIKALKRVSGYLALQRFDQIPDGVEKIKVAYDKLVLERGSRHERVFCFLDSLLETRNWKELSELQMGKIVSITKMLAELN